MKASIFDPMTDLVSDATLLAAIAFIYLALFVTASLNTVNKLADSVVE